MWGKGRSVGGGEQPVNSSPVDGGCIPLGVDWSFFFFPGLWVRIQVLDEDFEFSERPSSTSTILSRPVRRQVFPHFLFSLLSWWLFVCLFLTFFRLLRFRLPVSILFYCGILGLLSKRDVICSMSDHQLSMLLQFSEEKRNR